jgi:membrane-bound metal-dependent hydrolase YbcI (DUF457 family)
VDPISHVALGRTLIASAFDDTKRRTLSIAGILGALSPDVDAVFMATGWDRYLRVHEIGTHTVVGTIACAVATAAGVGVWRQACAWRLLAVAAWIGAASHVLLDLVSSARLRLCWPFIDRQFAVPLVAMADPWLGGLLVGGALASLLFGRARRPAALTLAACAALLSWKAAVAVRAIDAYHSAPDGRPSAQAHIVEARWASLSQWHVFDRTSTHVRAWHVDGIRKRLGLQLAIPIEPDSPLVAASRSFSTVRNFLRAHELAFAMTVARGANEDWVLWSDVRFCRQAGANTAAEDRAISAGGRPVDCALWVGGAFDRRRTPLREVVQIGGFTQTRGLSP